MHPVERKARFVVSLRLKIYGPKSSLAMARPTVFGLRGCVYRTRQPFLVVSGVVRDLSFVRQRRKRFLKLTTVSVVVAVIASVENESLILRGRPAFVPASGDAGAVFARFGAAGERTVATCAIDRLMLANEGEASLRVKPDVF